jgi:hypothetical protein
MIGYSCKSFIALLSPWHRGKLSPQFAGPFQVVERIDPVAYRHRLPDSACIHDVFHVGVLKPFRGTPPTAPPALPPLHHGCLLHQLARALRAQLHRGIWHVLKLKQRGSPSRSSVLFPAFQLEDALFVEGGEMLWWGTSTSAESGAMAEKWATLRRARARSPAPRSLQRMRV